LAMRMYCALSNGTKAIITINERITVRLGMRVTKSEQKRSCRPPEKIARKSSENPYATSRNPLNGAAMLPVPRLNLLCSKERSIS
jgi:hypothetical protein